MNEKIFKDTEEPEDTRSEEDILNEDIFSLSNMSNMISMSSNPNMYMPGIINLPINPNMYSANMPNINSEDPLSESPEDKKFS
ncbi:hypothetical protein K9O30_12075 [Clostridium bowmanii]|uniref:hypothetical protein n=1 Tax=Clostridium bowmanii TaxID=132925 RepID=UPI001C0BA06F|nr:hypothetical protein [Clostridium bowmanii]MBU3190493.1 hypothetical protein [Clostridium bowmanii]MCA1074445.1 hypothetical protein [Clostridium bowmanii]